jgi:hypothetical protein
MVALFGVGAALGQPFEPGDVVEPCNLPDQYIPRGLWNANLWPGGVVPYAIDAAVTATNRGRLRSAMDELQSICGVTFVPRTSEADYIYVQNGGGNNSYVGRIGGSQTINLVSWSSRYVICHELMHSLGVYHEQQRSDRETYVTIATQNIQAGYENNFVIRSNAAPHGPFDFESIMLYNDCSFSICCPAGSSCNCPLSCATIQAQPAYAQHQDSMGNRSYIGQGDRASLVSRYGAPPCPTSDFNCDGDLGTDADIEAFFRCLAGTCPAIPCFSSADFNRDGDMGTDADIESFFRVLAGGAC